MAFITVLNAEASGAWFPRLCPAGCTSARIDWALAEGLEGAVGLAWAGRWVGMGAGEAGGIYGDLFKRVSAHSSLLDCEAPCGKIDAKMPKKDFKSLQSGSDLDRSAIVKLFLKKPIRQTFEISSFPEGEDPLNNHPRTL